MINKLTKLNSFLFFFLIFTSVAYSAPESPSYLMGGPKGIFVNNRVLAKVNTKSISVIDVMKKMDLLFYKQYPQYTASSEARFQFYDMSWKHVLNELIDKELILADAEEVKIKVPPGEIRQEMENLFGPDIILNLDKVNLTFEEAWQMIAEDMKIRRMIFYRASAKAIRLVRPTDVRNSYAEYSKANIKPEEWHYIAISIRDTNAKRAQEAADFCYQFLAEEKQPLDTLIDTAKQNATFGPAVKITVSDLFKHTEKELSPAYKEVLSSINVGDFTKPIKQKSRSDKTKVFRIFYLKNHFTGGSVPFSEAEMALTDKLIEDAVDKETTIYLKRLRAKHHVQEVALDDFKPFILK